MEAPVHAPVDRRCLVCRILDPVPSWRVAQFLCFVFATSGASLEVRKRMKAEGRKVLQPSDCYCGRHEQGRAD